MNKFILWFTKITGIPIELIYFRRKTYYINKKNQTRSIKGSGIIVSNHTSVYDVALYMYTFIFRNIHILVAEIMFQKNKFMKHFLKHIGGIKVERASFDFSFITEAVEVINKGGIVEIFPESRLPRANETELLEFKPSFVYIALSTKAPIIPVYTNGCYGKKKRARVIIGEKIYLHELMDDNKSNEENIEYLCNYVRNYIIYLGEKMNEIEKKKK